jgi:hypothetical protein
LGKGRNGKDKWLITQPADVPNETQLKNIRFEKPTQDHPDPYVTPDQPTTRWKNPGPAAGPFKAYPGDGTEVVYFWYRFADQPALLHADLSNAERELLQSRVELLHKNWTKDRQYLPPPRLGELAEIDPNLIVTPPEGLEVGYVPIVTRQALKE